MYEKSESSPTRQKYLKAQENIDALYGRLSEIASLAHLDERSLTSLEHIEKNMTRLQMVLTSLQECKDQLLSVNLQVHRFTTEYGDDQDYKDCSLKEDITELYRQWDDIYEKNGSQLTDLKTLKTEWEAYDEKFRRLEMHLKEIEFDAHTCDTSAPIVTNSKDSDLRSELVELEKCALLLLNRLKTGEAWNKTQEELENLRSRIVRSDRIPHSATSPSANHPSSTVEEVADDQSDDATQLISKKNHSGSSTPQKKDIVTPKSTGRGRFWRIIRVAVPVQVALVLLYCLACYLEPGCCNTLNNFNFSFTPHLTYPSGKPPV